MFFPPRRVELIESASKPFMQAGAYTRGIATRCAFLGRTGRVAVPCLLASALSTAAQTSLLTPFPEAPSAVLAATLATPGDDPPQKLNMLPPCPPTLANPPKTRAKVTSAAVAAPPNCISENPLNIVVNSGQRQPLTSRQKGMLAVKDVVNPFNALAIAFQSGLGIAQNSHSAYGPGFKGFGKLTGYELVEDAQGEFFGVYLIPSLTHEDPRYRREQNASVPRRVLHALQRTIITNHDDGSPMINYATLLTYPISAELSNLYVPGVHGNAPSTAKRIGIGLATDPVGNLIAEFLPDLARRIHVRSIFIQQIVNQMALGQTSGSIASAP